MNVLRHPQPQILLTCAGVLLLLGALYGRILGELTRDWSQDPNFSHGFLIPPFSLYLAWERRSELVQAWDGGTWLGLPVLLLGVGVLLLGTIGAEEFLMRSSLIVVLAGLVLLHAGRAALRLLAFPLAFLFFMIPLPFIVFNSIAFPLQRLAAANAAATLDWLGIPVFRDGNVIELSHIVLGVTEACSGIRSLISLLALASVWAYLAIPTVLGRGLFVAAAIPITIVANAARVVITGLLGQWLGVEYARGFFHSFSGWAIFLVACACLFPLHAMLRGRDRR